MADETQQEGGLGGVEVKGMKTPFGGTYAGNVVTAASPELLKNMQDMIDQRTGGFNSFLEGMKDAVAITSRDPGTAMAARDQEKRLGQQSIFEMRQQMAMMKQQEKQAALQQAHLERQLANFGLNVPGVSGEGVGRTAGGGLDMNILQRVYDLGKAGHSEAAEKMLNTHLLDVGKARATNMGQKDYFSPTIQIQDSSAPGGTRMVSAAEINADPSLLPTAFGKKTLDKMQQQPTTTTTTTTPCPPDGTIIIQHEKKYIFIDCKKHITTIKNIGDLHNQLVRIIDIYESEQLNSSRLLDDHDISDLLTQCKQGGKNEQC